MTSTSIYLLIFFAAFLHALWNIIIKSLNNSLVGVAYKVFFQSIIFTPIIFFVPLPEGITWFYLTCSFLLHSLYFILLGIMYNREDLTFIYPVARGCAPIFVTIFSVKITIRITILLQLFLLGLHFCYSRITIFITLMLHIKNRNKF